MILRHLLCLLVVASTAVLQAQKPSFVVGSKKFTESVILGEMVRLLAERAGAEATHRRALGNTRIVFEALNRGVITRSGSYAGRCRTVQCYLSL